MDVPTLEVVVQAIDSLYHSPSKEEKQKANLWLTDLRTTVCIKFVFAIIATAVAH